MAEYTPCKFSKRQIIEAGRVLAGDIRYDPNDLSDALNVFRIARSWREANVYPMRRVRAELQGKIRVAKAPAITAARVKRMVSIRKKLRSTYYTLYQMQDIAGCRAIINTQHDLEAVMQPYLDGDCRHSIVRVDDHIASPQATGYRSHHLILKFNDPEGDQGFNRHFIEVQFRSRKQHSWATAVEAVGLVRGEDLKGGHGNPDWLRLFQIMAGEFADDEETPPVPGVSPSSAERRLELLDLDRRLLAVDTLDTYNNAILDTTRFHRPSAPYYLIEYDIRRMALEVRPFFGARAGSENYAAAENKAGVNSVLVEVEKVADLREAYPNYFLDVGAFVARLRRSLRNERRPRFVDWLTDWIETSRMQ